VTAPPIVAPGSDSLAALLALVDDSRARSIAAEDQLTAEVDNLYAKRYATYLAELQAQPAQPEEGDLHPFLDAALLAALVILLRRSFRLGSEEGFRFGSANASQTGFALNPLDLAVDSGFSDSIVRDFLAGQVDVASKAATMAPQALAVSLAQRARTGVLVAFHGGRSLGTEAALSKISTQTSDVVHKMWVANFDLETPPCPLCVRLHGTHIALTEDFPVPGEEPSPYLGTLGGPPRHPRCRCSLVMYMPTKMKSDSGPTPLSMALYADQVLLVSGHDDSRYDFVAATIVYVKPFTRFVNNKTQYVDGYYYDIQSGMKVDLKGKHIGSAPQKVSHITAKSLTEKAKGSTGVQAKASTHHWPPGTYIVELPEGDSTHTVVHPNGSSTSVLNDKTEDSNSVQTGQFLSYWDGQGKVTKPGVHGLDTPSTELGGTLPPGHHLLPEHKSFGGVEVHGDGSGTLYSNDFSGKKKLTDKAVGDIAKGHLGPTVPALPEDFTPEWNKTHEAAKAADALPDDLAVSEHPSAGPGKTLEKQSLFKVGTHHVAFDEGSQVFRSSSSKDTLYVLTHDGTVTKYNPQGSGVQATVVASSGNPAARTDLLSKLDNVSADGMHVQNAQAVPGTHPVYLGGLNLTSTQLEDALAALNSSPSPNISGVLGKQGSPLASTDVHAIAAPYKAQFNNKTKPAFIHALNLAHAKAGHIPLEATGPVSHLEEHHGLKDHHADLGNSDFAGIHNALHAVEGSQTEHDHAGAGPGLIEIYGVPFTPEVIASAIEALKGESSTSVKGPLKAANSPLAGSKHLNDFANDHAGGKLHYSKFKPTLIQALQAALDKHQQAAPAHKPAAVVVPEPQVEFHGVYGTKAQLIEARSFLSGIDISALTGDFQGKLENKIHSGPSSNPFLHNVDWIDVADQASPDGNSVLSKMNQDIHNALTSAIGGDKAPAPAPSAPTKKALAPSILSGPQVSLNLGGGSVVSGSTDQLQSFLTALDVHINDGGTVDDWVPHGSNPFVNSNLADIVKAHLGSFYSPDHAMQDLTIIIQQKLDEVGVPTVTEHAHQAMIDGKLFSKSDLLGAIDALKGETSTSVKGPLKANYPDLAKTDLKGLAEAHAGGPLHYGKLKPAVIAALQAQADSIGDPLPEGSLPPEQVVTSFGTPPAPSAPSTSLDSELASSVANPAHEGTWTHPPTGTTMIVNPDGSGYAVGMDGKKYDFPADGVNSAVDSGAWNKVADTSVDKITTPDLIPEVVPPSPGVKLSPFPGQHFHGFNSQNKPVLLSAMKQWAADAGYGDVAGQHMATKKKDEVASWLFHWSNGEWDKAYAIEAAGLKKHKASFKHPGSPNNPSNSGGFVKKEMAPAVDGEIPAGTKVPGSFPDTSYYNWDGDQIDAYLIAAQMQNPTGMIDWAKKEWVGAHINGEKAKVDGLSLSAKNSVAVGLFKSEPILPPVEKYAPGFAVPLDPSWPSFDPTKSAATEMTNLQLDNYMAHLGSKDVVKHLMSQPLEVKQQVVQLHFVAALPSGSGTFKKPADAKQQLTTLLDKLESSVTNNWSVDTASLYTEALTVKDHLYTKDAVQPHFGGGSQAAMIQVTDESGKTFIFKEAPKAFRADSEHAMHELAKLAGLQAADSRLGTFEGMFGQFQLKLDSKSSMTGVEAHTLPISALSDVMRSHVFDWAVNNDDAHSENFLLSPNGQHALPIDFGRAFAHFGSGGMRLEPGQLSNWADLYYNKVYADMVNGSISEKDTDRLYHDMIKQAKRMESIPDAAWSDVLNAAFERRPKYSSTSASNKEELIQQALDRKNNLVSDFQEFWDKMYAKMGREKPAPASGISAHVFSGNSADWHARAQSVGAGGAATFFAGTHLEDGHLLAQVVGKPTGDSKELWLSGQLRAGADDKLRSWLAKNVTGGVSVSAGQTTTSQSAQMLVQLGMDKVSDNIIAAAKTISHHHKAGDKNYNSQRIATFEATRADLQKKMKSVLASTYPAQLSHADRPQYLQMLNHYLDQANEIDTLRADGGVSFAGQFSPFDFKLADPPAIVPEVTSPIKIKVEIKKSFIETGSHDADGNLLTSGEQKSQGNGQVFVATLHDGTQIEYRSWHPSDDVPLAQKGSLKIRVRNYDGSTGSAEPALVALQNMGLELEGASEQDMELFYWRHLYGILSDRSDGQTGKHADVQTSVKQNIAPKADGSSALSPDAEVAAWRAAWSKLDAAAVDSFVSSQGYLPRFSHPNITKPEEIGGQPYWMRFDISKDKLRSSTNMPVRHSSKSATMLNMVKSGGFYSTEDRPKILGEWSSGMSSSSDQGTGASNFVFTRLNLASQSYQYYFSPETLARTSNYSFSGDSFGNINYRKNSSHFNFEQGTKHAGSSNETMIKHSLTVLDDMEIIGFDSVSDRKEAIAFLQSHGIYTIRGLPVGDRLVMLSEIKSAIKKINEHRKTWDPEAEDLVA
jgi:hypothetical protein